MTRARAIVIVLAIVAIVLFIPRGGSERPDSLQGYVEGYLVYLAAEDGGRIERLAVESGDTVNVGDAVITMDASMQIAQRDEAVARLAQAKATLDNLKAAQQRPEQIAVLEAQEERARAALDLSRIEFDRQQELFRRGISAKSPLDQSRSAFERDKAALDEVGRQIDAARLAGRAGDIDAAEAAVRVAEAALAQAETRLGKRRIAAPSTARVEDIYFRPGEVVTAGQPILAVLPPGNVRFRFYVPEPMLSRLTVGSKVSIACDGCADAAATVSFIARAAEYTPPVIFSEKERAKLVFRVEARPEGATKLPVGLPVDIRLDRREGGRAP